MKGVIFNLLEASVTEAHGAALWDDLIDAAGARGVYTSLGSYPDSELEALVAAAARRLGVDPDKVLRWFGQTAPPRMAVLCPDFFTNSPNLRSFVLNLNPIIHAEVHKLYPGATCPHFDFAAAPSGAPEMVYRSPRRMCALIEGFIGGAALHYGETAALTHVACVHHGAPACIFHLTTGALQGAADVAA